MDVLTELRERQAIAARRGSFPLTGGDLKRYADEVGRLTAELAAVRDRRAAVGRGPEDGTAGSADLDGCEWLVARVGAAEARLARPEGIAGGPVEDAT